MRSYYEKLLIAIVWRLPRDVVYWASIRLLAHATQGAYSSTEVPSLSAIDALQRWTVATK